ncbi:MAG: VWA domain-containing protein [Candidatus Helarchaeota archaeon]
MSDTREFDVEDTVILLDVSRSMFRKDFTINRIEAVKKGIIEWIKLKSKIDKADRFALLTFSTTGQVIQDYTTDIETVIAALKNVRIGGISALGEGMGFAVQFIGQKMAKAGDQASGGNVNRILLISDGKPSLCSIDPLERANVAAELGIITDCIEISKLEDKTFGNILESMAVLGDYYSIYDESLLDVTIKSLSHKKDVFELKKSMPNLALIAADLLDLTSLSEEMQKAVNKLMGVKVNFCEICRTSENPEDVRLCPYCKTGMHRKCARQWAEQSKMIQGGVLRCPHCLFLLKVPGGAAPDARPTSKPIPKPVSRPTPEVKTSTQKPIESTSQTQKPIEQPQGPTAQTAKVGDFILENDIVKLKIKLRGEEKLIYLTWDNWGRDNYSCNIMSGSNDLVCKDFHPMINWAQGNCTGFKIRDHIGWFSSLSSYGVLVFNIEEFEDWCKNVLSDISSIKKLIAKHPEIKFSSDKIMDFLLEAEVKFAEPLEVDDRHSLEGNLLLGAQTYLNLFESALPSMIKKAQDWTQKLKEVQKPTTALPTATPKTAQKPITKPAGPPPKPKSELAKKLEKLDKIPIAILAEKLGMSNIKIEALLLKMIETGELEGELKKGIFYRKRNK